MRQAKMVMMLGSFLMLALQCGDKESINNLGGRTEIVAAAIADTFYFVRPDNGSLDSSIVRTDSIRWVYEFPAEGPSSVGIIMSGWSQADLEVETFTGSMTAIVPVVRDSAGVFSDTVTITATPQSGVILHPQNSRLFVRNILQVTDSIQTRDTMLVHDTISLVNPW